MIEWWMAAPAWLQWLMLFMALPYYLVATGVLVVALDRLMDAVEDLWRYVRQGRGRDPERLAWHERLPKRETDALMRRLANEGQQLIYREVEQELAKLDDLDRESWQ